MYSNTKVKVPGSVADYINQFLYPKERAAIEYALSRCEGHKILDIGCGRGRTSVVLKNDFNADVKAFDISAEIIEEAKHLFPDISFLVMDARDLSKFKNESFDCVLFSFNGIDLIEPLEDRMRCLLETERVLKTGGFFIYSSHNRYGLLSNKDSRKILYKSITRIIKGNWYLREKSKHWDLTGCYHGTVLREYKMLREAGLVPEAIFTGRKQVEQHRYATMSFDHWPYYVARKL